MSVKYDDLRAVHSMALVTFIKVLKNRGEKAGDPKNCRIFFQSVEEERELIRYSFTHPMTVQTFFLPRAFLIPCVFSMETLLVAYKVAAKETAVPIAFKGLAACLTGYAIVVALPAEMVTNAHMRT